MPRNLKYKCPECGRSLATVEGMSSATQVVRRSCKCGKAWQLRVTPRQLPGGAGFIDVANFVEVVPVRKLK